MQRNHHKHKTITTHPPQAIFPFYAWMIVKWWWCINRECSMINKIIYYFGYLLFSIWFLLSSCWLIGTRSNCMRAWWSCSLRRPSRSRRQSITKERGDSRGRWSRGLKRRTRWRRLISMRVDCLPRCSRRLRDGLWSLQGRETRGRGARPSPVPATSKRINTLSQTNTRSSRRTK